VFPPLQGIHLHNYRNFQNHQESFKTNHTLFKGRNAVGKTNILEAISFLCPGTGFRKDAIQHFSNEEHKTETVTINYKFMHEELSNALKIEFIMNENRWSKQYFLNEKKIQQQGLLKIFQLFWFTEIDKVYFIKDTQYQRNTINRLVCYFEPSLFQLLNKFTKLRREKKRILQNTSELSWLQSLDKQLIDIGEKIIDYKINFLNSFQIFLQNEKSVFFDFEINPSFGLSQRDDFLTKFKQNLLDENQWPLDHKLQSENDPLKSIFEITHKGKKLTQLSSAQSKLLILSFLLQCAKFLNESKITIFLIDEIFDNFDMVNIQKVIQYCAENKFQTFFSSTDNFALQGVIKNLEIKEIT
jgi:DNA replication and repair protein RecF